MSVDDMVKSVAKCVLCGASYGQCACWVSCDCGWTHERGTKCRNPIHAPAPKRPRKKGRTS